MKPSVVIAYLDDVIIPSVTINDGIETLNKFLDQLEKSGLTLRRKKYNFLSTQISFLGHILSKDGIKPGESKINSTKFINKPTNFVWSAVEDNAFDELVDALTKDRYTKFILTRVALV